MQTEQWTEQVMRQIDQTAILCHRLILVVAPSGAGKTKVLQEVAKRTGIRYLNVNLKLSRRLLEFTERQRSLQVSRVVSDIVGKDDEQTVLLDTRKCSSMSRSSRTHYGASRGYHDTEPWKRPCRHGASPIVSRHATRSPITRGRLRR